MNSIAKEHLGNNVHNSTGFSWLFSYGTSVGQQDVSISVEDMTIVKDLAEKVKRLSELPVQEERKKLWTAHHALKETRPLIFIDPELAWYEILPHTELRCRGNLARIWEYRLRKEIIWQEEIKDDRVCCAVLPVQHVYYETGFGIASKKIGGENNGSYRIEGGLADYDDLPKLQNRKIEVDYEKTGHLLDLAHEVFDGILDVRIENSWWYSFGLTDEAIILRGFENFLLDFYDNPDGLHGLMKFLSDDAMKRLDFLENHGLLSLNNGGEFMGTGGYGWCDELPGESYVPDRVHPRNMWGYGESQETVSVSPSMFDEFVLTYQVPLLARFGLNAYGCCEPLDTRIKVIKEKVPRLRKITVSPWSNTLLMAEQIKGNYVYCWKMNPAFIATDQINEDGIRAAACETFTLTRKYGCPAEVLMRDVRTLAGKKENAVKWVDILMEAANRIYS